MTNELESVIPPWIDSIHCVDCNKHLGWNNTREVNAETAALCDDCLRERIVENAWR